MESGSYRTICGFCHAGCGLIVHVGPDGLRGVEGDPEHPANKGYVCRKVRAIKDIEESNERLTKPLCRTSEGLKPVTWDEALDFAAEKLTSIREKHGPHSLVRNAGAPVSYDARDGFLHFMQVYGSSNFTGSSNSCMVPRATAFGAVMGGKPEPDLEHARMIIFWGSNPLATDRYGNYCAFDGFNRIIARARNRGVRLVAIDPVQSETVSQVGEWIRIKPGTDIALGLAMINVVINDNLFDRGFVEQYSDGFEALREHVRDNTPAWAEEITGIGKETIVELATSFATTKPATICDGNGFDMYYTVVDAVRTLAILLGLTGNVDVPGGAVFLPFVKQSLITSLRKEDQIWHEQFPIFRDVPFPAVKESILRNEENRPRALIAHHSNPVLIQANQKRTLRAFGRLEFLMVDDIFMTATAEVADLVLPATSTMERYGYKAYSSFDRGFLAFGRPVADPPGEAWDVFSMEYELARRMGLGDDYPFHDSRSWVEHMLKPSGVTFEQLEEQQIVFATSQPRYQKYKETGFQTPSGKLEFYSQQFAKAGYNPLPVFSEATGFAIRKSRRSARAFPLLCTSRRPGEFVHTKFRNLRSMTKHYPEPLLWISPGDANARGIAEGDLVELSSPHGEVKIRIRFKADLEPGLVVMDFGWGNPTDGLASSNILTSDELWNPISGSTAQRLFPCEVVKQP